MISRRQILLENNITSCITEENYGEISITNISISYVKPGIDGMLRAPSVVSEHLRDLGVEPLFILVFMPVELAAHTGNEYPMSWNKLNLPATILLNGNKDEMAVNLIGIRGQSLSPDIITRDNNIRVFSAWGSRFCFLNSISDNGNNDSKQQTYNALVNTDKALKSLDMDFSFVCRTWIYLYEILDWYDDFNEARSSYFNEKNVFGNLVPASTGIGTGNAGMKDVVISALAVNAGPEVSIEMVGSPLQCPALDYSSSFSRAIKISTPDSVRLMVSGTASIDIDGRTEFVGDPVKQIEKTLRVVEAILKENDMGFDNVVRSIAYFPDSNYSSFFAEYCEKFGLKHEFVTEVEATVCRDDLLFEIELDAVSLLQ